jgi:hypothetical protein
VARIADTSALPALSVAIGLVSALGARLRSFLAHRDFLVIEIVVAFTSTMLAVWLTVVDGIFAYSPAHAELARLAPQYVWAAGAAFCALTSLSALILDALDSGWKVWARVAALALHAGLFAMLALGILLATTRSLAPPVLLPLVGACINGSYKVRRRASP